MAIRSAVVCVLCSLSLLAGCSKGEQKAAPAAKSSAGSGLKLMGPPHPRPGLWKTSITTDAGPGVRMNGELCLDEHTEDAAFSGGPKTGKADCSHTSFSPDPSGGVAFKTTCVAKGRTIVSEGVATGDFTSTYAVDVTTRIEPPIPAAPGEVRTKIQATYAGACRPGQKPGQATMKFGGLG